MGTGRLGSAARRSTAWRAWRERQLLRRYERRREHYETLAAQRGLVYDESQVGQRTRDRLARRGYVAAARDVGEIHTAAFIPQLGWHAALYPDLRELGPLSNFDYQQLGVTAAQLYNGDTDARRRVSDAFVTFVLDVHRTRQVDWIYIYASGMEILASALRRLRDEIGVPLVNMCLDDKQSWDGPRFGEQHHGQVDIAAEFDINWTSATVACEWYLVEGGNPLYMPEGFDASSYHPLGVEPDIDISFIGACYGFRAELIQYLTQYGLDVSTFGPGWRDSAFGAEQVRILNRSRINLGMGGIGYSEDLTNVKTRDFEVPGTGGGLYLTTYNPDLARHFEIGSEIICYRNRQELIELIRYYLRRPNEAREVSRRGRERCLAQHRWLHRYLTICSHLGVVAGERIPA